MSDDDFWTGADIMHKISQNKQEYQKREKNMTSLRTKNENVYGGKKGWIALNKHEKLSPDNG